jgi:hypothetical protein
MKRIFLPVVFIVCFLFGCKKDEETPACMQSKINQLNAFACDHGAFVKQYKFQKNIVYTLYPGDCMSDAQSEVIDNNCNTMGYLGGFTGNTQINGEEFSHAVYLKTVWSKP